MATSTDPNANSKTWELSLYELNRTPQSIITDNTEIAVSPRSLHSELMCPICLDMLKVTMTTKECLHRFCQDCIITALRSGNKECPTCRKKLVSKRSLRPDPNFDALISKIYPSREDYEAQQERVMAKVGKQHNFSANIEETLRLQAANRARGGKKLAGDEESALAAAAAATAAAVHGGSGRASTSSSRNGRGSSEGGGGGGGTNSGHSELEDEEGGWEEEDAELAASPPASDVELVIKPLPHGERVDRSLNAIRYLKTTVQATVDHISKYLEMRYDFEHGGGGGGGGGVNGSSSTSASEEQPPSSSLPSSSSPNLPSTSSSSAAAASDTNSKSAAAASNSTAAATSSGEAQQPNSSSSGGSAEGGAAAGGDLSSTTSTSTSSSKKSSSPFAIFIAAGPGQFHPLPGDWSLTAVVDKYWKVNRPLELFYAYKMASTKLADPGASARW